MLLNISAVLSSNVLKTIATSKNPSWESTWIKIISTISIEKNEFQ